MFTTEMTIVFPIIMILLVGLLVFFVHVVYIDLIEISANTLLFQKMYGASINNSTIKSSDDLLIDKMFYKREFKLSRTYTVDLSEKYPKTIRKMPSYSRSNPRVLLLLEYGVKRVINIDEN